MNEEVDPAIAAYCAQLTAEAELARDDVAEIEEHLRSLTDDLRAAGMPAAAAVTEAARRLGDPRPLAREHTRVRTPFGAKLSRTRAWSAAALLAPLLVVFGVDVMPYDGIWSRSGVELGAGVLLLVALVARLAWARALLLGGLGWCLVSSLRLVIVSAVFVEPTAPWSSLVLPAGIFAFLVPWRRGELSTAGLVLALQIWAYGAASLAVGYHVTSSDGSALTVAPLAQIAWVASMIACAGSIVRARWATLGSVVSALTLMIAVCELSTLRFRLPHADVYRVYLLAALGSGVIAAAVATVASWRTASSSTGSLRSLAS